MCENKSIILLGMMGFPSVFSALILLPMLLGWVPIMLFGMIFDYEGGGKRASSSCFSVIRF